MPIDKDGWVTYEALPYDHLSEDLEGMDPAVLEALVKEREKLRSLEPLKNNMADTKNEKES